MHSVKIISRPDLTRLPDLPLPFYVRSVGHYRFEPDYREEWHGHENFVQIFWGVKGSGEVIIDGESCPLEFGDVVWKASYETHAYRGGAGEWELRWFVFDGELADRIMAGYGYPRRLEKAGECPVGYFREIEKGLQKMTPYEQRRLVAAATAILALAGRRSAENESDRICEQYVELVHRNFADPNTDVNTLADWMQMHRTTLTRHFRHVMQCTPGEYLRQFRMQKAMTLLREQRLTAAEVACRVGIPNPSQFSRAVKSSLGRTPGEIQRGDIAL